MSFVQVVEGTAGPGSEAGEQQQVAGSQLVPVTWCRSESFPEKHRGLPDLVLTAGRGPGKEGVEVLRVGWLSPQDGGDRTLGNGQGWVE